MIYLFCIDRFLHFNSLDSQTPIFVDIGALQSKHSSTELVATRLDITQINLEFLINGDLECRRNEI